MISCVKIKFLFLLFIFLSSCSLFGEGESFLTDSEQKILEEKKIDESFNLFSQNCTRRTFCKTTYPNVYLQDGLTLVEGVESHRADEFYVYSGNLDRFMKKWKKKLDFLETKFDNPVLFKDVNGEKIDSRKIQLWIVKDVYCCHQNYLRKLLRFNSNVLIIPHRYLWSSWPVLELIFTHTIAGELMDSKILDGDSCVFNIFKNYPFFLASIFKSQFWTKEVIQKNEILKQVPRRNEHYVVCPFGVSEIILDQIFTARGELPKKEDLKKFCGYMIHLMNLTFINTQSLFLAEDRALNGFNNSPYSRLESYVRELKNKREIELTTEELKESCIEAQNYFLNYERLVSKGYQYSRVYNFEQLTLFIPSQFEKVNLEWIASYVRGMKALNAQETHKRKYVFIEDNKYVTGYDHFGFPNEYHIWLSKAILEKENKEQFLNLLMMKHETRTLLNLEKLGKETSV